MNRKPSIVVRSLVAIAFATASVDIADAAVIKIVRLNCAEWHARLALLDYRKEHPQPRRTHYAVGHSSRPHIHFVCDCKDGSADEGDARDGSSTDDSDGGVSALLGEAARGSDDQPLLSVPGTSSSSAGSPDSLASVSGGSWGATSGGAWSIPNFPSFGSPISPYAPGPLFHPTNAPSDPLPPDPTPTGPFPPSPDPDPTPPGPIQAAPEPSTWLLFGLGIAAALGLKRRRDGRAIPVR
jgi:hypothetical protein